MTARLRPLRDSDVERVLALNEAHVEVLSPLDRDRLDLLREWAQRFDVVVHEEPGGDEQVVGFVVVVGPRSAYDSAKYRWFDAAYDDFHYLDRIVLDARVHRRGLGSIVYDEVEGDAVAHGRLCLEVDSDPPNAASLAFHASRGFTEVARLGGSGAEVSLQVKQLA